MIFFNRHKTPRDELDLLFLSDPVFKRLWQGDITWADVPESPADIQRRKTYEAMYKSYENDNDIDDTSDIEDNVETFEIQSVEFLETGEIIDGEENDYIYCVKPVKFHKRNSRKVPEYTVGIKTLIIRNLPREITVETIRVVFEKYGVIRDIYIPRNADKNSLHFGTVKGFALIKFLKADDSAKAFECEYDGLKFGKNKITVEFAKEDR